MRDLTKLEHFRLEMSPATMAAMDLVENYDRMRNGLFLIKFGGVVLRVIAASGGGWDHVSVSTETRCPTWEEMELVAGLFFKSDEVAMQLHVPAKDHINAHPFVLHWWRPLGKLKKIPLPPKGYV